MYRSGSDTGFHDKCSAVRALRVYLRPRFSLHRTENDNITLQPLKCRYHSDMEFSVFIVSLEKYPATDLHSFTRPPCLAFPEVLLTWCGVCFKWTKYNTIVVYTIHHQIMCTCMFILRGNVWVFCNVFDQ